MDDEPAPVAPRKSSKRTAIAIAIIAIVGAAAAAIWCRMYCFPPPPPAVTGTDQTVPMIWEPASASSAPPRRGISAQYATAGTATIEGTLPVTPTSFDVREDRVAISDPVGDRVAIVKGGTGTLSFVDIGFLPFSIRFFANRQLHVQRGPNADPADLLCDVESARCRTWTPEERAAENRNIEALLAKPPESILAAPTADSVVLAWEVLPDPLSASRFVRLDLGNAATREFSRTMFRYCDASWSVLATVDDVESQGPEAPHDEFRVFDRTLYQMIASPAALRIRKWSPR